MTEILEFFKEFNIQTILSMGLIVWYFTREIKSSLESKIDNLDQDMKIMNKEFHAMNTRVSRVEGTVYGKDIYKEIK